MLPKSGGGNTFIVNAANGNASATQLANEVSYRMRSSRRGVHSGR